jgi:hypothetical protein
MVALFAAALWTIPTSDEVISGLATYYAPNVMEAVAVNRGMSIAGFRGGVALNRAGDLGRTVWLEYDGEITGPYRVVDCAHRGVHFEDRLSKGYIVEVDYRVARDWGIVGVGPVPVRVHFELPTIGERRML